LQLPAQPTSEWYGGFTDCVAILKKRRYTVREVLREALKPTERRIFCGWSVEGRIALISYRPAGKVGEMKTVENIQTVQNFVWIVQRHQAAVTGEMAQAGPHQETGGFLTLPDLMRGDYTAEESLRI
jgi:hypothetical protein